MLFIKKIISFLFGDWTERDNDVKEKTKVKEFKVLDKEDSIKYSFNK